MSTLNLRGNEKSDRAINTKAIRAAMQLKGLRPTDLARNLEVSLRAVEYYLAGKTVLRCEARFLEMLQPELAGILSAVRSDTNDNRISDETKMREGHAGTSLQ